MTQYCVRLMAVILAVLFVAPTAMAQKFDVQGQLQKLKREPQVRQVQEASLRYFRVNNHQVNSMRARASWKALMPVTEISGGYTRSDLDEETKNFEKFLDGSSWLIKGAGGSAYEIRGKLSWNLPQLIFNPEELDVASLAGLMEGILKESTRLYFMRRRLQVDMILSPPTDRASLLSKQLRLEELTGLIDAMTNGWFQRQLSQSTRVNRRKGQAPVKDSNKKAVAKPAKK